MPAATKTPCDIKDIALAEQGKRRIEWANQSMPVLQVIRKQFIKNQPLAGIRIAACLHVTAETANLMITLRDGGASLVLCAANSLSTEDAVAASLVKDCGISTYAIQGEDSASYSAHIQTALDQQPQIVIDDGGGMMTPAGAVGAIRLRSALKSAAPSCPVITFENRHGTGQSIVTGILRTTNLLMAGLNFVVAGYGRCGEEAALRARGLGASVMVCETNPTRALDAVMDGHRVMSIGDAARTADIFVAVAGYKNVLGREHFDHMKDGAMLFSRSVEIDIQALEKMASGRRPARPMVDEYTMRDGRKLYVLNPAAGESHPAAVMDLSFANQALSVEHLLKHRAELENRVYRVPETIDRQVAKMKLESMGIKIDRLTPEQEEYESLSGHSSQSR